MHIWNTWHTLASSVLKIKCYCACLTLLASTAGAKQVQKSMQMQKQMKNLFWGEEGTVFVPTVNRTMLL